jgi:hypothetical protein
MRSVRLSALILLSSCCAAAPAFADETSEKAASELLERRMKTQRPDDLIILKSVQGKDIVVVRGSMDHIEQVLTSARIRHVVINPEEVANYDLKADQIVMVNCPGNMPPAGIKRIEKFVRAGGLLYTTDWSLLNLVQVAFPGTIAHNGQSTGSEVTPVQVIKRADNLMSNMLLRDKIEPQWWLEGGSYPIKILDKKKVEVLAMSREMGQRYGAAPIVVRFKWDDGEVIHVVSHFYRQVETHGPAIAAKDGIDTVEGLTVDQKKELKASPAAAASKLGDVESSYAFQQMTSNLVVGKAKQNEALDKTYDMTPKAPIAIGGRTAAKGDRLKVLKRAGKKVTVRDDRGNEGELDEAQIESR